MEKLIADTNPNETHGWRWRMHHNVLLLFGAVTFMGAAMFTGIPLAGQVAWAAEEDRKVDTKIQAAVGPIEKKVDTLSGQVNQSNRLLVQKLAADIDDKIVQTTILRCNAKSDESVEYFRRRVAEFIDQYIELTGRDKRAPTCADTK